jgi:hypothetical protein
LFDHPLPLLVELRLCYAPRHVHSFISAGFRDCLHAYNCVLCVASGFVCL